jgi:hypothetical protein
MNQEKGRGSVVSRMDIQEELFEAIRKENLERERRRVKAVKYAVAAAVLSTASAILAVTDNPVSGTPSLIVAAICLGCLLGTLLISWLFLRRVDDARDSRVIFSANGSATLAPGAVARLMQKTLDEYRGCFGTTEVHPGMVYPCGHQVMPGFPTCPICEFNGVRVQHLYPGPIIEESYNPLLDPRLEFSPDPGKSQEKGV